MKKNNNYVKINSYSDLFSVLKKLAEAPENQGQPTIQAVNPQTPPQAVQMPPQAQIQQVQQSQNPQQNQQAAPSPVETSPYDPHVSYQQIDAIKKIKLERRITVEEIVEKINSIRAGRSLSNKNIRMQLEVYFDQLDEEERLSLFAFLAGLSQIVTGEVSGKIATDPEDVSYHPNIQKKIDEEEKISNSAENNVQQNLSSQSQQDQPPPAGQQPKNNLPISANVR